MRNLFIGDGPRRRSPRISALENPQISARDSDNDGDEEEKLIMTRIKRKADDVNNGTSVSMKGKQVWKGREGNEDDDCSINHVARKLQKSDKRAKSKGKSSSLPPKHVLELVLDMLQRKDNNEMFAQPVDRDEVKNYYEIIKEPMDFGTMRAKLHEGMYENLEQFERDCFLIPENAMHFNSSSTARFRQARIIHELAKEVFHVLRTDPENFGSEFSGTRRRSMRKLALNDAANKETRFSNNLVRSSKSAVKTRSKRRTPSNRRRTRAKNPNFNLNPGKSYGGLNNIPDRRSTYLQTSHSSLQDENDFFYKSYGGSIIYSSTQSLFLMNKGDITYQDSLMSFAKDLGPIAQAVAKRKLLGQHEQCSNMQTLTETKSDNNNNNNTKAAIINSTDSFVTFRNFASLDKTFQSANAVIDLTKDEEAKSRKDDKVPIDGNQENENMVDFQVQTVNRERGIILKFLASSSEPNKYLNSSTKRVRRRSDDDTRPVILALENSHFKITEYKPRNRKSIARNTQIDMSPLMKIRDNVASNSDQLLLKSKEELIISTTSQPKQLIAKPQINNHMPISNSQFIAKPQINSHMPVANSQFTFDISFLKTRLNQMNSTRFGESLRNGGGGELKRELSEKTNPLCVLKGSIIILFCTTHRRVLLHIISLIPT